MSLVTRGRQTSVFCTLTTLVTATVLIASSFRALAAEPGDKDRYTVSELGLNFEVPESPAFTVLDLNPQTVTRPATPRDFATALINGLDKNGNFQSGLAIEFNVWGLANRNDWNEPYDIKEAGAGYWDGPGTLLNFGPGKEFNFYRNFLYRTALSFATTKGSDSEDKALRIAAGVRTTPWDPGDARLIMGNCLVGKMRNLRDATGLRITNGKPLLYDKLHATEAAMKKNGLIESAKTVGKMIEQIKKKCQDLGGPAPECPSVATLQKDLPAIWEHVGVKTDDKDSEAYSALDTLTSAGPNDDAEETLLVVQGGVNDLTRAIEARYKAEKEISEKPAAVEPEPGTTHGADDPVPADDPPARIAKATADKIVGDCRTEEKGRWNGSSLDFAVAPSWISKDGSSGDAKWNGGAVWSSLALGSDILDWTEKWNFMTDLGNNNTPIGMRRNYGVMRHYNQVILHARYRFKEREPEEETDATDEDDDGANTDFAKQDTWLVGLRYRFLAPTETVPILGQRLGGLDQRFGVSLEASLASTDVTGNARELEDDTYLRWAVIPTFRITENMWIDVAFGTESGKKGDDDAFVLSSIKYGYGEGPWPSHASHGSETTSDK